MAVKKTSKKEILKEAIRLFKLQGYYNTSMADIAFACGILKGSLYHHFKSKDDVGLASLRFIHDYFVEEVYAITYHDEIPVIERIEQYIQKIDAYFLQSEGGCIFGNFALEIPGENENFREIIREDFDAWVNSLDYILQSKYPKDEAYRIAKEHVALTQGAIMMMNLRQDSADYLSVGQKIITLLKD